MGLRRGQVCLLVKQEEAFPEGRVYSKVNTWFCERFWTECVRITINDFF